MVKVAKAEVSVQRVWVTGARVTAPTLYRAKWAVGVWDQPDEPNGGEGSSLFGFFVRRADARRFADELRAAGVAGVFTQVNEEQDYITDRNGVRSAGAKVLAGV